MNYREVVIFDVSGEYGHFRKFNTTTSPLTYSIPTPSAIYGLLGAILGIERESSVNNIAKGKHNLRELFSPKNVSLAIRPMTKIKKVRIGFNLLDTGSPQSFFNITNRTQIEYEILKDPKFRVYLFWEHSLKEELIERLQNKNFYFTPYLGISQMTADIIFIKKEKAKPIETSCNYNEFITAINLSEIESKTPIDVEEIKDKIFQVETLPIEMGIDRKISRYGEILVEANANSVKAMPNQKSFFVKEEGNIQLL